MIIDGRGTRGAASFVFFIVAVLVTEVLFVQFLLCNSLNIADRCIMDASLSNDYWGELHL